MDTIYLTRTDRGLIVISDEVNMAFVDIEAARRTFPRAVLSVDGIGHRPATPTHTHGDDVSDALAADVDKLITGATGDDAGASIPLGEAPGHGFYVGIDGRGIVFDDVASIDRDAVAAWLFSVGHVDIVAAAGSWRDVKTGRVYFDASSHHAELETALTVADNRGELAVWDIPNGREVRADGTVAARDLVAGDVVTSVVACHGIRAGEWGGILTGTYSQGPDYVGLTFSHTAVAPVATATARATLAS